MDRITVRRFGIQRVDGIRPILACKERRPKSVRESIRYGILKIEPGTLVVVFEQDCVIDGSCLYCTHDTAWTGAFMRYEIPTLDASRGSNSHAVSIVGRLLKFVEPLSMGVSKH